jgi:uncharacterized membrane protein YhdT
MRDSEKVIEDPRFRVCFREMLLSYGFYFVFFLAVMAATYLLGKELVLGLPLWFLIAGIVIPIIFIVILYFIAERVFQDTPLDPYLEDEEEVNK